MGLGWRGIVGGADTFSVAPLGLWCWVMQACYTPAAFPGLKFYGNLLWGFYRTLELTLHSAGVGSRDLEVAPTEKRLVRGAHPT